MAKGIVRFCFRKEIDAAAVAGWERNLFDDTYREFFMQAQQFDQQKRFTTFREMFLNVPDVDQMVYLVSTAAVNYIRQLNGIIPGFFNVFGKPVMPFKNFRFDIIESSITHKEKHKVAISFYSEPVLWHESFNDAMIVSIHRPDSEMSTTEFTETETLPIPGHVSIAFFRTISEKMACDDGR
jgi:hypothetical protein